MAGNSSRTDAGRPPKLPLSSELVEGCNSAVPSNSYRENTAGQKHAQWRQQSTRLGAPVLSPKKNSPGNFVKSKSQASEPPHAGQRFSISVRHGTVKPAAEAWVCNLIR